jgi:hypothetical protein
MFSIHGGRGNVQLSGGPVRLVNWSPSGFDFAPGRPAGPGSFVPLSPGKSAPGSSGSTLRGWISRLNFKVYIFRDHRAIGCGFSSEIWPWHRPAMEPRRVRELKRRKQENPSI